MQRLHSDCILSNAGFDIFSTSLLPPRLDPALKHPDHPQGAHTFCVGLDAVPAGDWFCSDCEARREISNRQDAILRRVWSVASSSSDTESVDDDEDWSIGNSREEDSRGGSSNSGGGGDDDDDDDDNVTIMEVVRRSRASGAVAPRNPSVPHASSGNDVPAAEREVTLLSCRDSGGDRRDRGRGGRSVVGVAGGVAGPNLWPRVLVSAAAVAAPRYSFFETGEGEEGRSNEEKDDGDGEDSGRSVVEQSFADATLAAEVRCSRR